MSGSMRPPFPSAPSDPALRRLGVGPAGGRARPLRAQLVVIVVLALTLLAVPLYLMRRPSAKVVGVSDADAGSMPSASASPSASVAVPTLPDAGSFEPEKLKLSEIRKVRCGSSARQSTEGEACDSLPSFEKALLEAVKTTGECVPKSNKPGTINFVLEVDFTRKTFHVFPGASGDWRGVKARRATKCAKAAFVAPDFATAVHQYRHYAIAVMATYPASAASNSAAK